LGGGGLLRFLSCRLLRFLYRRLLRFRSPVGAFTGLVGHDRGERPPVALLGRRPFLRGRAVPCPDAFEVLGRRIFRFDEAASLGFTTAFGSSLLFRSPLLLLFVANERSEG